jgi:hypothetical protein
LNVYVDGGFDNAFKALAKKLEVPTVHVNVNVNVNVNVR